MDDYNTENSINNDKCKKVSTFLINENESNSSEEDRQTHYQDHGNPVECAQQ